ncbi:MAG: hypothetical protein JO270_15760 [Acidobacteriaceae bacterium]|nr:hypothetical protein [Acidobacteriaceae bacterium]
MIKRISWMILGVLLASTAFARDEYVRTFDKTLTLQPGQRVFVEHKFGDVIVRTHPQAEIVIHAVIHVSAADANQAKSYADRVEILVEPSSSEISIRTRYPDTSRGGFFNYRSCSYSMRYEITMPETAPLEVRNSFGGISVTGVKGGAQLTNSHGNVESRNGAGTEHLENAFGSVRVEGNAGDVSIENTNGSIDASDIKGMLNVRDRFASINTAHIGKGVTIANNNGSVEVNDCGGPASVRNSFGSVSVHNIQGDLTVNNGNGSIEAAHVSGAAELNTTFSHVAFADIGRQVSVHTNNSKVEGERAGGPVTVRNSFGEVHINEVGGLLSVRNQNGSVEAAHAKGAQIATSFASVIIQGIDGPIQIENQNGAVEASSAAQGRCQPVIVHTSFAPIRVRLPGDASYAVFAKTSFAKIHTDFPLLVSGSDGVSGGEISGKIGSGACELRLTNNNGPIEIMKSGP